jgi:flavodoxin-like protein
VNKELTMTRIVVYESVYGNTRAVAEAVADGLGGALVVHVEEADAALEDAEIVVVGGPTHMHGLSTALSRRMGAEGAHAEQGTNVELDAAAEHGLRRWLHEVHGAKGLRAATFDTRVRGSIMITGSAARVIARRMRRHGFDVLGTQSFFVPDGEGRELERARAWGATLAAALPSVRAATAVVF